MATFNAQRKITRSLAQNQKCRRLIKCDFSLDNYWFVLYIKGVGAGNLKLSEKILI